jgi:hypothetical protein
MAIASKVEEAQRAVEAAEQALTECEREHGDNPTEKSEADLARARRRVELARGTLAKRTEQATAAAALERVEAEHKDARAAERAHAASALRGGANTSAALREARARTEQAQTALDTARAIAARDEALDISADESAELRASVQSLTAQLARAESDHATAELAYADAPSDVAWSRVLSLRGERDRAKRDLSIAAALLTEAERADLARQAKASADDEARRAIERRELAERELLPLGRKLNGDRVERAVRAFMDATHALQAAIVELADSVSDHNTTLSRAAALANETGRQAPTVEAVAWENMVRSLRWWTTRARGAKGTGYVEHMLSIGPETQPRGAIATIFERAQGDARRP